MMPALGVSVVVLSAAAGAEPVHIEQQVAPACVAAASELEARVARALGEALPKGLAASVVIEAVGGGFRATMALRDAEQARGTTAIEAPTCAEAVDAAAVVLALALGQVKRPEASQPAPSEGVPEPRTSASSAAAPARPDRDAAAVERAPSSSSEPAMRLALATGVDRGTLPHPTLVLAGAWARSFGGVELAAVARYGLPTAEEQTETAFSESLKYDFASLELRGCPGLGQAFRFSACAGAELGAVRARHELQGQNGVELDTEGISPRLSATLAAGVRHRGGLVEPGLELAGAAVALGRPADAPWLSVRVAASASIAF